MCAVPPYWIIFNCIVVSVAIHSHSVLSVSVVISLSRATNREYYFRFANAKQGAHTWMRRCDCQYEKWNNIAWLTTASEWLDVWRRPVDAAVDVNWLNARNDCLTDDDCCYLLGITMGKFENVYCFSCFFLSSLILGAVCGVRCALRVLWFQHFARNERTLFRNNSFILLCRIWTLQQQQKWKTKSVKWMSKRSSMCGLVHCALPMNCVSQRQTATREKMRTPKRDKNKEEIMAARAECSCRVRLHRRYTIMCTKKCKQNNAVMPRDSRFSALRAKTLLVI